MISKNTNPNLKISIYGLSDPRNNIIRYVGWTSLSLRERLSYHLKESNSDKKNHRLNWIRKLKNEDITPDISEIESCLFSERQEKEKYWIKYFGRDALVNGTDGGEGTLGSVRSEETKKKLSDITKSLMTDEMRNHLSLKTKAFWAVPENKARMSKSLTGRKIPDNHLKGRKLTESWLEKISLALSGKNHPMYGKHHSDETKRKISDKMTGKLGNNRGVKRENSSSKYYGVYRLKDSWTSILVKNKDRYNLIGNKEEINCAIAYDIASIFYYGNDCNLNFPNSRQSYMDFINQFEIADIKELRKVIREYINNVQGG